MKLKSYLRRAVAGALCLLICAAGLCQSASAAGLVLAQPPIKDFTAGPDYSFTIRYKPHWDCGAQFRLYQVASMVDENAKFETTAPFKKYIDDYNLDLDELDEKYKWDDFANYLHIVATTDKTISHTRLGKLSTTETGSDYKAEDKGDYALLTFEGLYPGLYLVVGDSYERKETLNGKTYTYTYTPNTYLVCIPNWEDGTWTKNVLAKAEGKVSSTLETTKSYMVFKIWDDNKNAGNTRPESIQVVLYRGRDIAGTATLSKENDWQFIWSGLPVDGLYWAREISVSGYTSKYEDLWNTTTKITNTYAGGGGSGTPSPNPDPSTNPSSPVVPSSNPSPSPSSPVTPSSNPSPSPSSPVRPSSNPGPSPSTEIPIEDPDVPLGNVTPPPVSSDPLEEIGLDDPDVPLGNLPQTGQLWWPVPLLIAAGIILVLIGIVRRRTGEYYDE